MTIARAVLIQLECRKIGLADTDYARDIRARISDAVDEQIDTIDAAGFAIVPKELLKPKVNAKALAHLDDMAEADIAMDGDHALSILLKHYRELTAAKETP